jgi:hypothetical protein
MNQMERAYFVEGSFTLLIACSRVIEIHSYVLQMSLFSYDAHAQQNFAHSIDKHFHICRGILTIRSVAM